MAIDRQKYDRIAKIIRARRAESGKKNVSEGSVENDEFITFKNAGEFLDFLGIKDENS